MAEVLGIVGSIAGLITLAASTSSLLTGISSTQTRRLVASLDDLMPVLRCILHTLGSQQYHPHPQAPEIQLLAAPVVSLYAVLHRLDGVLQNPGHWWERRERRELVDILVDEIERAKTTMILAFGLVNWRALEALRVAVAAVLEGQRLAAGRSIGAVGGNGVLTLREETRLRVQAEMEGMMTAEIRDVLKRAVARTMIPAASAAFFFDLK